MMLGHAKDHALSFFGSMRRRRRRVAFYLSVFKDGKRSMRRPVTRRWAVHGPPSLTSIRCHGILMLKVFESSPQLSCEITAREATGIFQLQPARDFVRLRNGPAALHASSSIVATSAIRHLHSPLPTGTLYASTTAIPVAPFFPRTTAVWAPGRREAKIADSLESLGASCRFFDQVPLRRLPVIVGSRSASRCRRTVPGSDRAADS